jgi:hypothetical protein
MLPSILEKHHTTRRLHIHTPSNTPLRNLNQHLTLPQHIRRHTFLLSPHNQQCFLRQLTHFYPFAQHPQQYSLAFSFR